MNNFFRFCFILFLAIFINLLIIQNDFYFRKFISQKINNEFGKTFACNFKAEVVYADLFTGKLVLKKVNAKSLNENEWSWNTPKVLINTNFFAFIFLKKLFLNIECYDLSIKSLFKENDLKILPHLKLLIADSASEIPIIVKSFFVHQGNISILDTKHNCEVNSEFGCNILNGLNKAKSNIYLKNGHFAVKNKKNIFNTNLKIYHSSHNDHHDFNAKGSFNLSGINEEAKDCYLVATFKNDQLKLEIESSDNTFKVKYDSDEKINFYGQIPLSLFNFPTGNIDFKSFRTEQEINFNFHGKLFEGLGFNGQLLYDFKKSLGNGQLNILLDKPNFGNYKIGLTSTESVNINFNFRNKWLKANLNTKILNLKNNLDYKLSINCELNNSEFSLAGNFDKDHFKFHYDLKSLANNFEYVDANNVKLMHFSSKAISKIKGHITVNAITETLKRLDLIKLNGTGNINLEATIDYPNLKVSAKMEDGNIILPFTNNIFKEFESDLNFNLKKLELEVKHFSAKFLKGKIFSSQMNLHFLPNLEISYLHAPLIIRNLYLSWKTDFFAEVQGLLLFEHNQNSKPSVKGNIILMRSNLAGNILSEEIQKNFIAFSINPLKSYKTDAEIDINLTTQTPLKVKTKFLESAAKIHLGLTGNLFAPHVCGRIELYKGVLNFPYAPLYITSSKIEFYPDHSNEPTLDLIAKNRIKKYNVIMTISGKPSDPQIEFESEPHMSKEEIIALLLSGSQGSSLYTVMPHVLMQNLKNLLFSSENPFSKMNSNFKNFFKPLENIRIVPSFTDQTARGGLRGKLEIDVNDRLHGLIEKNFSLSEDVKIEVEYDITDEVAIRAVKDERGDLGGEVEMRWKF